MSRPDHPRSGPSRRAFLGSVTSASSVLAVGLFASKSVYADENQERPPAESAVLNPIPGGVAPFAPFGVFIHHNPLNPAAPLASINDPSQVTDFDGFVGLTHIRGGGTGTSTTTGDTMSLAYQADMGFSQGRFIGIDGQQHEGTFAFV
jgi:hypothetical protein